MLFKSLWKMLLAVGNRVVIERVDRQVSEDGEPIVVVSVRLRRRRTGRGFAVVATGCHLAMTRWWVGVGGAIWTRERPAPSSRRTRRGSPARSTGPRSLPCRGRAITWG